MPDVFLSHSSVDAETAGQLVTALEDAGLRCWIAPRNIGPGTWGDAIIRGIESCRVMVVLFTSSSNDSRNVLREVERAFNKSLVIVPFRIDESVTSRDLEYFLSANQWLDARRPPFADRLGELVGYVRSALAPLGRSENEEAVPVTASPLTTRHLLNWAQLYTDTRTGAVLAHDRDGHFLYWGNIDQTPIAGKFPPVTEVLHLQGDRALTRTMLAWHTCQPSGTVDCWRLCAHPEIIWTHTFVSATGPDACRPLCSPRWVVVPTGRQHLAFKEQVTPMIKVVDYNEGKLKSSISLEGGYPFGFWEREDKLLFYHPTSHRLADFNGGKISVLQDFQVMLRDIEGSISGRQELLPQPDLRPSFLSQRALVVYTVPGKIVARDLSDSSASAIFNRAEATTQGGSALLSADGKHLIVWNWVGADFFTLECYEMSTQQLVGRASLSTSLPTEHRRMYGWDSARDYAWDPETKLFLLLGAPTETSRGEAVLHLWQMPECELVGMQRWLGNRPVSAVFGAKSTCYIGTETGEVFSLRLPALHVDRQLA